MVQGLSSFQAGFFVVRHALEVSRRRQGFRGLGLSMGTLEGAGDLKQGSRGEAEPFSLGTIPAAAGQNHSGSLMTPAAAAATALTTVDAPGAQQQQQQ